MWTYRAFKAVQSVIERLPRGLAYALAVFAARFAHNFARKARARLEFNLRVALPNASDWEIRKISWLNFRNHSKAYADLMLLPRTRVESMRNKLSVTGWEHLEEARAHGKGVMVVSAHMGSWEVVAAIWAATIAPVSLFAEELEPKELYQWYRDTRARVGISVLPINFGGLRKVTQALQDQEMVITAIDRDITGTGQVMPFFGRPARIPLGPAAIALRLGTPVFPVCVYRLPDDSHMAEGSPALVAQPTGDHRADSIALTQQLLQRIEGFIKRHPEQWHVPHRIWDGAP